MYTLVLAGAFSFAAEASTPAVKVAVTSDGLCRVTSPQMAAALNCLETNVLSWLAAGQLAVYSRGRLVAAEYDTTGISFFGQGLSSRFTGMNVYWIEPGAALRATTGTVEAAAEQAGQAVRDTVHFEQNATVQMPLCFDPSDDPWFWQRLVRGGTLQKTMTTTFVLPGFSAAESLTLAVKGTAIDGGTSTVSVTLNGTLLSMQTLCGLDRVAWTFGLTGAPAGTNNTMKIVLTSGADVLVDWYDVTYLRKQIAIGGEMMLSLDDTTPRTVGGFEENSIELFHVPDNGAWQRMEGGQVTGGAGDYRISFQPTSTGRWLAVSGGARWAPAAVTGRPALSLKSFTNAADHLVITVPAFDAAADDLVAYRNAHGLISRKVYVEDIYDEFNCGIPDPRAIRAFLGYAYRMWARAPRYVLMLGEGSVDYRNYKNFGDCMVPPMIHADDWGQYATDNLYGDIDGCKRLEISVGRLPVMNAAEAATVVHKIKTYEAGGAWKTEALAMADNPDFAGDFTLDSEAILPRLAPEKTSRVYLETLTLPDAREAMFSDLNEGRGITTYIGHANPQQLSFEGLLTSGDISTNLNSSQHPGLLVALTCLVGSYGGVGQDLLAEQLSMSPNGPAAIWAAASQVYSADNRQIGMNLISNAVVVGWDRLGDSVLAAVSNTVEEGRIDACNSYNLLSDPALAVYDPMGVRPGNVLAPTGPCGYPEWLSWAVPPVVADRGLGLGASDDPDGDGHNNEAEWLAGTDPLDASSRLQISHYDRSSGQVAVRWPIAPQRTYRLESARDIMGPFSAIGPPQTATPDENALSVQLDDSPSLFFRVVIE